MPTRSCARRTRSSTIIRRSGARSSGPSRELPRTEGTRKLKRAAIRDWVKSGGAAAAPVTPGTDALAALVAKYAGRGDLTPHDDARGARAELARARRADGRARRRVSDAHRRRRVRRARAISASCGRSSSARRRATRRRAEPVDFPAWNRAWPARAHPPREPADLDSAARAALFAWMRVEGREHLRDSTAR